MNVKRALRWMALLALFALVVPPLITVNRVREGLAQSISGAIGRPVSMGDISIRILPQPGFDINRLVVSDDPAFSAEPLLQAEEVTAALRLTSLWRGRLEIAKLSLKNPSLNLARNREGKWNVEQLLEHASQVPSAPTTLTKPEARPRFPYIEAGSGRINFKALQVKQAFALADADFALWLESENEWQMRLEARPMRTDANLSDTGTFRIEGSFQRAESFDKTAFRLRIATENTQLGQLTSLIFGKDRGWRGNAELTGEITGTPEELRFTAAVDVREFRRYDIAGNTSERIQIACEGEIHKQTITESKDEITGTARQENGLGAKMLSCRMPAGAGEFTAHAGITNIGAPLEIGGLTIRAKDVPMTFVAGIARNAKRDLPGDFTAAGTLNAEFAKRLGTTPQVSSSWPWKWRGEGVISGLRLESDQLKQRLDLGKISFGFDQTLMPDTSNGKLCCKPRIAKASQKKNEQGENILTIDPFSVALGGTKPATVRAEITREGSRIQIKGGAEAGQIIAAARLLGLRRSGIQAQGALDADLVVSNPWENFGQAITTGTAQLRKISASMDGVAAPLEIESATLVLDPENISLRQMKATLAGARTVISGSVSVPRACEDCPARFDLRATEVNLDELNRLLNPKFRKANWLAFSKNLLGIGDGGSESALLNLYATGNITADRLAVKSLTVNKITTEASLRNGKLALRKLRGEALGGKHNGEWLADFTADEPTFEGSGSLEHVSLTQANAMARENWANGTASGKYQIQLSGTDVATLKRTAAGEAEFSWKDGSLHNLTLRGNSALRFASWEGRLRLGGEKLSFISGTMRAVDAIYQTSGSASFTRTLDMRLVNSKTSYAVTGTLGHPVIRTDAISAAAPTIPASKQAQANANPAGH